MTCTDQVETINDQYMVAAGLPDRFSDHATEICSMALHLLDAVKGLAVPQMPEYVLRLRIGIHTGLSVCLSVVVYLPVKHESIKHQQHYEQGMAMAYQAVIPTGHLVNVI